MKRKPAVVLEKVKVEDYAAEGKSLARVDGKVVFIENVVPGDLVDVKLGKNKKDWAEGWPVRFHEYSSERSEPFCQHFGVCGGCQWQMLPYHKQLEFKERQVRDHLQRIGKIALPPIAPILGAAQTTFYRNKVEYTFGTREFVPADELREGKRPVGATGALGFHAKGHFDKVVDIKTCYLQDEPTNEIREVIREFAFDRQYSFYDIRAHDGLLRTMQVRLCTTGELMLNIVFGFDDPGRIPALMEHLLARFPSITTLLYTINRKKNDSLHDLEPITYAGRGFVFEEMEGFRFKIGPKSFFQTNTKQAEQLYRVAREFAELTGKENVYDLYCGTGSIGIFLSKKASRIVGVEAIDEAVDDARENARLNEIRDARFFCGDVIDVCNDDFFAQHEHPDVIITDPPRAGMHEKLVKKIMDISAPLVVYVSCNPATQARDLNLLDEKYSVTRVQPVDMFPHTLHIENVVQLKLK